MTRALTARRYLAFKDSMAFVEQMTRRIFHVIVQEGDELLPCILPEPHDRPVFLAQRSLSSSNAAVAAAAFGAV